MSLRSKLITQELPVTLELIVTLKSFTTHDGFREGQLQRAIEEFKEKIEEEILSKIVDNFQQQQFLFSSDFVEYEITSKKLSK